MKAGSTYKSSSRFPLHGAKQTGVKAPFVEIVDAQETVKLDPTVLLHRIRTSQMHFGNPFEDSILSGKPAYLFRTEEVELALTAEEIGRLVLRGLSSDEYFHLATRVGVFWEISEAFYNEETGRALAPKYTETEDAAWELRSRRPQLLLIEDLDGNLRPHSITSLKHAMDYLAEIDSKFVMRAQVLDFSGPSNAWRPDPFDNAILVLVGPEGQMRAYGRFANEKDAENFMPRDGGFGYGMKRIVASVNASAVF